VTRLSEAKYQSGRYKTHAGEIHLERGELCHAESFMAEKFGWHKSRLHRFLNRLAKADMIDRTTRRTAERGSNRVAERTAYQIISIRKYNDFQAVALPKRTDVAALEPADSEPSEPQSEPRTEPLGIKNEPCAVRVCGQEPNATEPRPNRQPKQTLRRLRRGINDAANSDPPSAAQEASQRLWSEGLETLSALANPFLGETKARRLIGRWISRTKGPGATPENVLRAIDAAAAAGTPQPVPYIEAILKNEAGGVRREGDDWLIPHGTEEYSAHRRQLQVANSPEIYRWPDTPGHVARARSRWPMRVVSAA